MWRFRRGGGIQSALTRRQANVVADLLAAADARGGRMPIGDSTTREVMGVLITRADHDFKPEQGDYRECAKAACLKPATHVVVERTPHTRLFQSGAGLVCADHAEELTVLGGTVLSDLAV